MGLEMQDESPIPSGLVKKQPAGGLGLGEMYFIFVCFPFDLAPWSFNSYPHPGRLCCTGEGKLLPGNINFGKNFV